MIELQGVSHSFGRTEVLRNVSLTLRQGELTAVIGPNGAGKSTLLHLIARLLPLGAGRVAVDGLDVSRTPPREIARRLAFVAQDPGLMTRLKVGDYVAFGRWPWSQGRLTDDDHTIIANALAALSISDLAPRYLDELSGGQRQMARVAMALAQDTGWILLDEPLNHLDMAHARALMERLHGMARERGVALVIHDVNHAAVWADRIIALKDGVVVADGAPREVLTKAMLREVFGLEATPIQDGDRIYVPHHR